MKMKNMKRSALTAAFLMAVMGVQAMCGCMFPLQPRTEQKMLAGSELYNRSSKVIIVRDGERTIVTMANDFRGDVSEFAMVVPVPEVVTKDQIKVVDNALFTSLDRYTAPRMVESWDLDPCASRWGNQLTFSDATVREESVTAAGGSIGQTPKTTVKVEEQFSVGEYDIVVLSAKESSDMAVWLKENGYFVSERAEEVISPYIKQGMKFFVAKVNVKQKRNKFVTLQAMQITFNTPRFTLPIRFGMANSEGNQDMIVYGMSRQGRVEATNYRTVNVPSGYNLPEFIPARFEDFYESMFQTAHQREGGNVIFLEYSAGNKSVRNDVLTNPFSSNIAQTPAQAIHHIDHATLSKAGVDWLTQDQDIHVTRLRVRYNRKHWPQDIRFQVTPNTNAFHAVYNVAHRFQGKSVCAVDGDQMKNYRRQLSKRRSQELQSMVHLTGWSMSKYAGYQDIRKEFKDPEQQNELMPVLPGNGGSGGGWTIGKILLLLMVLLVGVRVLKSQNFRLPTWRTFP